MSDYFKNKNRNLKGSNQKILSYQPEYERLNIDPLKSTFRKEDFMTAQIPKLRREISPNKEVVAALPPQVKVRNGDNEEYMWNKSDQTAEDQGPEFKYDEIPYPPQEIVEDNVDMEDLEDGDEPQNEGFNIANIECGQYVLIYFNQVIGLGALNEIQENLKLLLESNSKFSLDNFVVLKRVGVKVGILLDE